MTRPTCLGYCVLEVSDLDAWKGFATNVVGLQPGASGERTLALRADSHECRVLLQKGPADDIAAAGWEFPDEGSLEAYVADLRHMGVEIVDETARLAASRFVRKLYSCRDPGGWAHEFHCGSAVANAPFSSALVTSGFVTGRLGLGHLVISPRDADGAHAFYRDVLGFTVSDHIRAQTELVQGATLEATFYHGAGGRHHSIAVAPLPGYPKALGHLMVEARDIEDVGRAFDRFVAAGLPILSSIGQHPNDRMVSFYAGTPSGFAIEFGCGGLVIDDATWSVRTHTQASAWGHKPPAAR
ncbi:MAG TPA: VOC family protein [Nevskiaceae bacterium]|nr:VOC family protein [Nevskiaceae bacterium]